MPMPLTSIPSIHGWMEASKQANKQTDRPIDGTHSHWERTRQVARVRVCVLSGCTCVFKQTTPGGIVRLSRAPRDLTGEHHPTGGIHRPLSRRRLSRRRVAATPQDAVQMVCPRCGRALRCTRRYGRAALQPSAPNVHGLHRRAKRVAGEREQTVCRLRQPEPAVLRIVGLDDEQLLPAQLLLGWVRIPWRHLLSAGPAGATTPAGVPAPSAVTSDSADPAAGIATAVADLPSAFDAARAAALAAAATPATASDPAITSHASWGAARPTAATGSASLGAAARTSASITADRTTASTTTVVSAT